MLKKLVNLKTLTITGATVLMLVVSGCSSKPNYRYSNHSDKKQALISNAKKMIGVRYRYGGTSPSQGFDCSGLVQYSMRSVGIHLPRSTQLQYSSVRRISKRYLKAGDLVFFKTSVSRAVSHVGIYLGNNKFIHAPSSGKHVTISSMLNRYWRNRFTAAGRVL